MKNVKLIEIHTQKIQDIITKNLIGVIYIAISPSFLVVSADFGQYIDTFEKEDYIGIGWFTEDPAGWDFMAKD